MFNSNNTMIMSIEVKHLSDIKASDDLLISMVVSIELKTTKSGRHFPNKNRKKNVALFD